MGRQNRSLNIRDSADDRRQNSSFRIISGGGEGEVEAGAFAEFALGPDLAAVAGDDVFHNGEAEAGAALITGAGFIHTVKALEDAIDGFGGNAGAVVLNADFNLAIFQGAAKHFDGAVEAAVFNGVVHEVGEDLVEAVGISLGGERREFVDEFDVAIFGLGLEMGEDAVGKGAEFDGLELEFQAAAFEGGNGEEVLDEEVQAMGVALDDFEEALGDFGVVAGAVEEGFDVAFDEGERGAEFVRDVGDEFLALALELFEAGEVAEDEDGAFAFAGGVGDDGGVDLKPAFLEIGQLDFVVEDLGLGLGAAGEVIEFMEAEGFHDGFAAEFGLDVEQVFEGAVDEVDFVGAVEEEQALEHGVEEDLLLGFGVNGGLLLAALGGFEIGDGLALLLEESAAPPEMGGAEGGQREDEQEKPHAIDSAKVQGGRQGFRWWINYYSTKR